VTKPYRIVLIVNADGVFRKPQSTDEQPEELVEQIQLWVWMVPLEHGELLTCQILKRETVTRPKETKPAGVLDLSANTRARILCWT